MPFLQFNVSVVILPDRSWIVLLRFVACSVSEFAITFNDSNQRSGVLKLVYLLIDELIIGDAFGGNLQGKSFRTKADHTECYLTPCFCVLLESGSA